MKKLIMIITILLSLLCASAFAAAKESKPINDYSSKPAKQVEVHDVISVYDNDSKLTAADKKRLQQYIQKLESEYDVRILYHVIYGVKNGVARDYARTMVDKRISGKPAMIFVVTTKDRQYYIAANKAMRELAVSQDYGIPHLKSALLPNLKQNHYGAAGMDYLVQMDELLAYAREHGHAHEKSDDFSTVGAVAALVLAAFAGMCLRSHLIAQLNNVSMATEAGDYFQGDSFELKDQKDTYLYSNTVIISTGSSSGGSGGGGDGGSGGSGGGGSY